MIVGMNEKLMSKKLFFYSSTYAIDREEMVDMA
jgi:hypothetical protein